MRRSRRRCAPTGSRARSSPTTARYSPPASVPGQDRSCSIGFCIDNGIRHILTAPRSPTTTGKVERFHRTLRREFFSKNDYLLETIEQAQAALEAWLVTYNTIRPHQSIGDRTPAERFALRPEPALELVETEDTTPILEDGTIPRVTRRVDKTGRIHLEGFGYLAGRHLAGEVVEIAFSRGLLEIAHRGSVVATHARRRQPGKEPRIAHEPRHRSARPATSGPAVTRVVDSSGSVSFAGWNYRVGNPYKGASVEVAIVGRSVQISYEGAVVKEHPIRHDRSKEFGAFSMPNGRPRNRKVNRQRVAG